MRQNEGSEENGTGNNARHVGSASLERGDYRHALL